MYLFIVEPECSTNDKLLLLACEDGTLQLCDVRNRNIVSLSRQVNLLYLCELIIHVPLGDSIG